MWRDICLANRTAILKEMDQYLSVAAHLRELIANEDAAGLEKAFTKASKARQEWDGSQ
jgi:prephenate dehydrogenase